MHTHTQLLHMLAQYVNSLEGDKRMLRAQVKRLVSDNNWLRKELNEKGNRPRNIVTVENFSYHSRTYTWSTVYNCALSTANVYT